MTDAEANEISGHAIIVEWPSYGGMQEVVSAGFARTLERELDAAHAARDAAIADADECREHRIRERDRAEQLEHELAETIEQLASTVKELMYETASASKLSSELAAMTAERDKLSEIMSEALEFWRHYSSMSESSQDDMNEERHAMLENMASAASRS